MYKSPRTGDISRRGLLKGATALGAAGLILPASVRRAAIASHHRATSSMSCVRRARGKLSRKRRP